MFLQIIIILITTIMLIFDLIFMHLYLVNKDINKYTMYLRNNYLDL